ncbi:MAG: gliding motility-associated protein GldE [Bacteroidetes bacterium]|nr:gliding motility-associated protein GldE [Bacteroidota bacterium]
MDPGPLVVPFHFSCLTVFLSSFVNVPSLTVIISGLIGFVLVFCSALMAASEIAFFSISHAERDELRESEEVVDKRLVKLLDRPRYLLSTILIGNNVVNIGVIIISYFIITHLFNFQDVSLKYFTIPAATFDFTINVLVVTFFLVLFGEAIPKVYASHNKMKIAKAVSGLFVVLNRIFYPLNYILVGSTSMIEKRIKRHNAEMDIEEINKAIEITVENKESGNDVKMLKGIVHFGNLTVKQIMRQRMEVAAADITWGFEELLKYVREVGYSRIPVYSENIDQIQGILYIKDLLEHINQDGNFGWQKLIREPLHAPETKKIDDMLREFQESRMHLAIVVDEFGGTCGIVTMEDIVEEVIGDIKDEFDESTDTNIRKIDDNTYIIEGVMPLNDFSKALNVDPDYFDEVREDAETLAGLLLEIKGRIPKAGEEINYEGFTFRILSIKNNRIEKVKLEVEN